MTNIFSGISSIAVWVVPDNGDQYQYQYRYSEKVVN